MTGDAATPGADDFTRWWSPAHDVCHFRDLVTLDVHSRSRLDVEAAGGLSAVCAELRKLRPRKMAKERT